MVKSYLSNIGIFSSKAHKLDVLSPDKLLLSTLSVCYEKFLNTKHLYLHDFCLCNISLLKNIKINCPHNTVQIDVLKIKPTVLYDTKSVIRKHFSTKSTVQYKPGQAESAELCPPPE